MEGRASRDEAAAGAHPPPPSHAVPAPEGGSSSDSDSFSETASEAGGDAASDAYSGGAEPAEPDNGQGLLRRAAAPDEVARVLFLADGVLVRPAPGAAIAGRLSIVERRGETFIAWLPEQPAGAPPAAAAADRRLYAVHPVALAEVRSVTRRAPFLREHSVTLALRDGSSLPPFCFARAKAFVRTLKQRGCLTRCPDAAGTFLVDAGSGNSSDPLSRSLHALDLAGGPPSWPVGALGEEGGAAASGGGKDSLREQLRELVDGFQRLAAGARGAAAALLTPALEDVGRAAVAAGGGDPFEAAGAEGTAALVEVEAALPPPCDLAPQASAEWELVDAAAGAAGGAPPWDRPRPPPLSAAELAALLDAEGRLGAGGLAALRERAFRGGVAPAARPAAWRWLLGVDAPDATAAARAAARAARARRYRALRAQWATISPEQAARHARWAERVSRVKRDVRRTDRAARFFAAEGGAPAAALRAVLLTHVALDFDLGYAQGMSDLAAPLLYVARGAHAGPLSDKAVRAAVEADAFWLFVAAMRRAGGNFAADGAAMTAQLAALRRVLQRVDLQLHTHLQKKDALGLFYAYRWILVWFKREFVFSDALRLWEALWAAPAAAFHLFVAAGILMRERRRILDEDLDFDGLLRLCCTLTGRLDVERALRDGERLAAAAGGAGRAAVAGLP